MVSVLPKSSTSLNFTILQPNNVVHSLLANYTIYYSTSRFTDFSSVTSQSGIMYDTSSDSVGIIFSGNDRLSPNTAYWVAVRATNSIGMGDLPTFLTFVETFGIGKSYTC